MVMTFCLEATSKSAFKVTILSFFKWSISFTSSKTWLFQKGIIEGPKPDGKALGVCPYEITLPKKNMPIKRLIKFRLGYKVSILLITLQHYSLSRSEERRVGK